MRDIRDRIRLNEELRKNNVFQKKEMNVIRMKEAHNLWDKLIRKGNLDSFYLQDRKYANINGFWKDQPCFVVGSGPTLGEFLDRYGWSYFDDKHTIGINHTIEDYDKFEWFFFLDQRFLDKTSYDITKYKGRIFAQCTTKLKHKDNVTLFHCKNNGASTKIEDGLFSPNFSGLAALNLAIISGANPIYLVGLGMGAKGRKEQYHYRKDYKGIDESKNRYTKYKRVYTHFKYFNQYKDRIINITSHNDIPCAQEILIDDFGKKNKIIKKTSKLPLIAHMSFTDDINKMGDVSRNIINNCYGKHKLYDFKKGIPNADLYILEHFLSTNKDCINFPYKKKSIDIIHTTNCIPKDNYAKIITLTDSWKKIMKSKGVENIKTIKGAIDISLYEDIVPAYGNNVFGRITRWSPGKVHPEWNRIVSEILNENEKAKCLVYTHLDNISGRKPLEHSRAIYNGSINIGDFKGHALNKLSIYVHANNYFKETMSHAVIEAMATGLPIVYLAEGTEVLEEVVGEAGIRCTTIKEVKKAIMGLLNNIKEQKRLGAIAKEQAKKWDCKNSIRGFNKLIKEVLCLK